MRHVAQQLAAYGRNGDTTLVHMSEGEVQGLRALARKAGTSLTTNPHTGLPEAFNLMSLLPIAAGFIPGVGPLASMALGAGLGALTNKGNPLMGAISGGLGAYGGGNLAGALSGAGESALASTAASEAAGSAMSAPAADLAAAGVDAGNAAVAGLPQAPAGIGALENPSAFSSAASNATAANPADTMRAFEHGYANTVTGGSGAWDAARQAAQGAPMMGKLGAGLGAAADDPSKFLTMQNAKGIAMPLYGSMALNPANQGSMSPVGGDNGSQWDGELFMDQRTFVPGLPGGIQRSRAVRRRAEGGITSVGSFGGGPGATMIGAAAARSQGIPAYQGPTASGITTLGPYVSPYAPVPGRKTTQPVNRYQDAQRRALRALETRNTAPAPRPGLPSGGRGGWQEADNPDVFVGGAAAGGPVGQYLRGPGDGMSDDIDAMVHDTGEGIRVAANEYVVPADVVSHLGNGSSDAGAKVLEQMGARVRAARTGNPKQGKQIDPTKFVPR